MRQALRYAISRRGMLATVGAPMRAFVRSREGLAAPDVLLGWVPMLTEPGGERSEKLPAIRGNLLRASMRPESKGHIHIVFPGTA